MSDLTPEFKHRQLPRPGRGKLPEMRYDEGNVVTPLRDLVLLRLGWRTMHLRNGVWLIADPKARTRRTLDQAFDPSTAEALEADVLAVGPKVRDLRAGMRVLIGDNRQARGDGVLVGGVVWNLTRDEFGGRYDIFMREDQVHAILEPDPS